jgi:hypothetical protein
MALTEARRCGERPSPDGRPHQAGEAVARRGRCVLCTWFTSVASLPLAYDIRVEHQRRSVFTPNCGRAWWHVRPGGRPRPLEPGLRPRRAQIAPERTSAKDLRARLLNRRPLRRGADLTVRSEQCVGRRFAGRESFHSSWRTLHSRVDSPDIVRPPGSRTCCRTRRTGSAGRPATRREVDGAVAA